MRRFTLALALAAIALPAYAQAPSPKEQNGAKAGSATQQFVTKAAVGDMYEIQSSQMALEKTQDEQFRTFAQRIVDDHTKASAELKSIAQQAQGTQVPSELDAKHKDMINELQSASGPQFEKLYRDQQLSAHREAVQLYQTYSESGDNAQLTQFASKTLPRLREHLQMVQSLRQGQTVGQAGTNQKEQGRSGEQSKRSTQQSGSASNANVIATPGQDHILSSALRGTRVYGSNQENIGEINDVVLNREGQVVALVVGVGGFLGLGEKDVAIPFDALEIRSAEQDAATQQAPQQQANERSQQRPTGQSGQQAQTPAAPMRPNRIVLKGMTKQELEAAPSFSTRRNGTR